jgi:hypothetical protein
VIFENIKDEGSDRKYIQRLFASSSPTSQESIKRQDPSKKRGGTLTLLAGYKGILKKIVQQSVMRQEAHKQR